MDGKQIVQRTVDAWNARDRDGFLDGHTADCRLTAPAWSGTGRPGLLEFWAINMDPMPDNRFVLHRLVEDGGCVVEEAVFEGTHTAPMPTPDGAEIPPTGRRVSVPLTAVHDLTGDRIGATRFYYDLMGFFTQLGIAGG